MAKEMSDECQEAIKEYSGFLVRLAKWNATEIEFEMRNLQDRLGMYSKDVRPGELPVVQLMQSLAEGHAHSQIISYGLDPFTMGPIVRLENEELSF